MTFIKCIFNHDEFEQVVYQTLRDVGKRCEWRPGTERAEIVGTERPSGAVKKGGTWMDTSVGQDAINETVYDVSSTYTTQTLQKRYHR